MNRQGLSTHALGISALNLARSRALLGGCKDFTPIVTPTLITSDNRSNAQKGLIIGLVRPVTVGQDATRFPIIEALIHIVGKS